MAAKRLFGMEYVIFRPHNVYGPRQNLHDPYRNVIGIFMNQLLRAEPMSIFGDGEQTRAFSYIDDVAPLIAKGPLVEGARNQVFNVGADAPHSLNNLASAVHSAATAAGVVAAGAAPLTHLARRVEVEAAFADHSKLRCFFQPPAPVPLAAGLERMVAWLASTGVEAGIQPSRIDAVEIRRQLPPSWEHSALREQSYIETLRPAAGIAPPDRVAGGAAAQVPTATAQVTTTTAAADHRSIPGPILPSPCSQASVRFYT